MTDERYKAIMDGLGMPQSVSLLGALKQVANEVAQEERARYAFTASRLSGAINALKELREFVPPKEWTRYASYVLILDEQ